MRQYVFIIFVLLSFNLFSQEVESKDYNKSFTWQQSDEEKFYEYYFGIKPISASDFKYHFQFITLRQIIDLYSKNGKSFSGQLINYAIQNLDSPKGDIYGSQPEKFVFDKVNCIDSIASIVGLNILNEKLYKIPTDSLIQGWNFNWLDCGTIDMDYKIGSKIYYKSYSCLKNQNKQIDQISKLQQLENLITNKMSLVDKFESFKAKLPSGKHYRVNGMLNMYVMTELQSKMWTENKPERDYKKSIKDTIDLYLEKEFKTRMDSIDKCNCYNDYIMTFSKSGKLKDIDSNIPFWDKISDKNFRTCRRKIKKVTNDLVIDFVDPKYEFQRIISFYNCKIRVNDPTNY